jgi:hypothetical protein
MQRKLLLYILIVFGLPAGEAAAQHLSSPHAVAMGAFTAVGREVSAIDWNPAGLTYIRDWELRFTSYMEYRGSPEGSGPYFSDMMIGKRLYDTHALAFRYAPGVNRQFLVATDIISPDFARGSFDILRREVEYTHLYSIGYARSVSPLVSVGVAGHFTDQRFSDPEVVYGDTVRIQQNVYSEPLWTLDAGLLYAMRPDLTLGLTVKNLLAVREESFPAAYRDFSMKADTYLRAGAMYSPLTGYTLAVDLDTRGRSQFGHAVQLFEKLSVRQGNYFNFDFGNGFEAISGGVGLQLGTVQIDASYLHFFDTKNRGRGASVSSLVEHGLEDLGYNQFTANRFDISARLQLGRMHEPLARIEYVEIMSDVYPASFQVHAYRPIAKVRVKNVSHRPIESRVGFYVKNIMEQATESRPHYMLPGETVEIPITAIFTDAIKKIADFTLQTAEVYVRATTAQSYDDRRQMQLAVHGRNDWNGEIVTLRYFLTPEEPRIMQFTREILNDERDSLEAVPPHLEQFRKTRILFDRFSSMLLYVNDPRKTHNRVQYPAETLDLRGGDCDDMAVAFASMLASVGIASAFVDIVPPEAPHTAHVYLLVDTGVAPDQAESISTNPKRYVIRKNEFGRETVWIPLETTATKEGFRHAWDVGAESYYNEGIIQGGLINGWMRVVDIPRL